MSKQNDRFPPIWANETDWLVEVVLLPAFDGQGLVENLDWIGKLLAFSMATDTRMLAIVSDADVPTYELWFSFRSQKQKEDFLQIVRDDEYSSPDEEDSFDPPDSLQTCMTFVP